jgi:hypothetical protein
MDDLICLLNPQFLVKLFSYTLKIRELYRILILEQYYAYYFAYMIILQRYSGIITETSPMCFIAQCGHSTSSVTDAHCSWSQYYIAQEGSQNSRSFPDIFGLVGTSW